jgi:hypothetical protein
LIIVKKHGGNTIKVKLVIIIGIVLLVLISYIIALILLKKDDGSVEPLVTISDKTYNSQSVRTTFYSHPKWADFNERYGKDYSASLQGEAYSSIEDQAIDGGEEPSTIKSCIGTISESEEDGFSLPCLAEKGFYTYTKLGNETTDPCWIFVINWGFGDGDMGHIKIYVISAIDYSILFYESCD